MKTNKIIKAAAFVLLLVMNICVYAQINATRCFTNDTTSSAIGKECVANGDCSFAGGWMSRTGQGARFSFAYGRKCIVNGSHSILLGYDLNSSMLGDMAIGSFVDITGTESIVIGSGVNTYDHMMVSQDKVIALGIGSNIPTMKIFRAMGKNKTGKIAIGNIDEPQAKLHVLSDNQHDADILIQSHNGHSAYLKFQNEHNNISVGSDNIMNFTAGGFALNTPDAGAVSISSNNAMNFSATSYSFTSGKVGIGCTNTSEGFTLAVQGGILTDDVLVRSKSQWPDFVFGKDYSLMPLPELKKFIGENRHLPNVPSESEVAEKGVSVSEMQTLLLQKVEELTLYTIQQQEMMEAQQEMIEQLRQQCGRQQEMIDKLMGK